MPSMPVKRLALAPPGNFHVRVLLTELYPDQNPVVGAAACRSNESLNIDDYLIFLQKFGLDEPDDVQIDELNLIFQANYLPLSVFQVNCQNHDRELDAYSALPTPTTSTSCSAIKAEMVSADLNPRVAVTVKSEQDMLLPLSAADVSQTPNLGTETSDNVTTSELEQRSTSKIISRPFINGNIVDGSLSNRLDLVSVRRDRPVTISCSQSSAPLENSSSFSPTLRIPVFAGPLTDTVALTHSSQPSPQSGGVLKSFSKLRRSVQPDLYLSAGHNQQMKVKYIWPRYDKPRLRVFASKDSGSSDSHYSDSESCHPVSGASSLRNNVIGEDDERWTEQFEESDADETVKEDDGFKYYPAFKSSPSTSSGSLPQSSRPSDRNIRDVNILKRLGVPFAYDEIAYSSNELFREMKSRPGLSLEQISAMLDARRRATNRAAADRCRRMKSQARDSLTTKLGRLRMKSANLRRHIIHTRKHRQRKRDRVSSTERGIIRMFIDDNGLPLNPSQWRIHLTAEGEAVIMRLDHGAAQFVNSRVEVYPEPASS